MVVPAVNSGPWEMDFTVRSPASPRNSSYLPQRQVTSQYLMDTNVRSTFLFTRHTVPVMLQRKQGTVLTISSMAGVYGFAGEAVYCATKFAQVGFAQALDKELRIHGIKVGVICPGGVKTEFAIGRGRYRRRRQ
jgi:short-subunit dehydrogenase